MSNHTPGPWDIKFTLCQHDHRWMISSPDGARICYGDFWHGEFAHEGDANARLIAAAPAMYAFIEHEANDGNAEAITIMEAINGRT